MGQRKLRGEFAERYLTRPEICRSARFASRDGRMRPFSRGNFSAAGFEMSDLARKKRISGKIMAEIRKKLQGAWLVFFAYVGNGEQDASEGCEIVSACGRGLKIGKATLFVRR